MKKPALPILSLLTVLLLQPQATESAEQRTAAAKAAAPASKKGTAAAAKKVVAAGPQKPSSVSSAKKPSAPAQTPKATPPKTVVKPVVPVIATVNAAGEAIWLPLNEAKKAALANKKPLVADFYTNWCSWCKVMDKNTFHNPEVAAYLGKNFVCARVNAEDGGGGEDLARKWTISGYPTVMVFTPKGEKLRSIEGFVEPAAFLSELKKITYRPQ